MDFSPNFTLSLYNMLPFDTILVDSVKVLAFRSAQHVFAVFLCVYSVFYFHSLFFRSLFDQTIFISGLISYFSLVHPRSWQFGMEVYMVKLIPTFCLCPDTHTLIAHTSAFWNFSFQVLFICTRSHAMSLIGYSHSTIFLKVTELWNRVRGQS